MKKRPVFDENAFKSKTAGRASVKFYIGVKTTLLFKNGCSRVPLHVRFVLFVPSIATGKITDRINASGELFGDR